MKISTSGRSWLKLFFFFQAEDGIRDKLVTGVQTCALPILKDQWGGAYDQRVELAKRALRTFGAEIGINEIGDAGFQALEKGAGGGVQLIKLLAAVGARTTEDTFQA